MKSILYHRYGDRSVLAIEDVDGPAAPGAGQVRVRVHASSINPVDGKVRRGELKLIAGGHFPKRPGLDFSGNVEDVGPGVEGFARGDEVFGAALGMSDGAMAERILVKATAIAHRPSSIDAVTAAGIPTVAIAALQTLRDVVKVAPGDRILVNGCTGGVGLYALQLARAAGAHVTGVCGSAHAALAREFGAQDVIDYAHADGLGQSGRYRAILELSGKLSFEATHELLDEQGLYVDFSPSPAALIGNTIANPFRSQKHVFALTGAKTLDLEFIAREIDAGSLKVTPTEVFEFERFAEAYARAEAGRMIGKIVLRLPPLP